MTPPAGAGRIFARPLAFRENLALWLHAMEVVIMPPGQQEGIPPEFGAAPRGSSGGGLSRFLAMTRNFALGTFGLALLIFLAEKIFPAPFTPSHMIGNFVASVEVAEIKSKQDYASGYAAAMAEAQAQAQARAQIEIEVNRQQQQRLSNSMGMQVAASNLADFGCYAGNAHAHVRIQRRRRKHPVRRVRCRRGDPPDDGAGAGRRSPARPVPSKPVRFTGRPANRPLPPSRLFRPRRRHSRNHPHPT